jgi:hypothetical protein
VKTGKTPVAWPPAEDRVGAEWQARWMARKSIERGESLEEALARREQVIREALSGCKERFSPPGKAIPPAPPEIVEAQVAFFQRITREEYSKEGQV